jgi:hypothetical protein
MQRTYCAWRAGRKDLLLGQIVARKVLMSFSANLGEDFTSVWRRIYLPCGYGMWTMLRMDRDIVYHIVYHKVVVWLLT